MNKDDARSAPDPVLTEVRGVSAAVTGLARYVEGMNEQLKGISSDVAQIKQDLAVVKTAVSETTVDMDDHERRIRRLEKSAAL